MKKNISNPDKTFIMSKGENSLLFIVYCHIANQIHIKWAIPWSLSYMYHNTQTVKNDAYTVKNEH